jgi:hypothetical protein
MEPKTLQVFQHTVQYSGDLIWIRPVCDFFEISVQNQHRKLKSDPIFSKLWIKKSTDSPENPNLYGKSLTDLGDIDQNGRILLSKKGFMMWLYMINPTTIKNELQPQFFIFKEMISDFLYGHVEVEVETSVDYRRLSKLKRLYGIIGREIQRLEKKINGYLENKFQLKLQFDEPQDPRAISSDKKNLQ